MSKTEGQAKPTAADIARELRCACTQKRCSEYGCAHGGVDLPEPGWRCPPCQAYEYLIAESRDA